PLSKTITRSLGISSIDTAVGEGSRLQPVKTSKVKSAVVLKLLFIAQSDICSLRANGVELSLGAQASSPAGFSRRAVSASKQARTPALPGMATFLMQCHCPSGYRSINPTSSV